MGMLIIETRGSFGTSTKTFSAMRNGHAHAVTEAIRYLTELARKATNQDHQLHEQREKPTEGFTAPDEFGHY